MNAYDFDNTIYDGESIFDFFKFCIKKDLFLLVFFPKVLLRLIEYKLNLLSIDKLYNTAICIANSFMKRNKYKINDLIEEFWSKNKKKLKPQFLKMLKSNDLIITGCPNFLINYIKKDLKVENIISTQYNFETNKIEFICLGKNKVKAFNEKFKDVKINKFYTDSLSDIPFMQYANKVYLVKDDKISEIDKKKYIK
jgi:phosphoserine phosphatase